jgi:hypothetical protein
MGVDCHLYLRQDDGASFNHWSVPRVKPDGAVSTLRFAQSVKAILVR